MQPKPSDLKQPLLCESALVWDESLGQWITGFQNAFKLQHTHLFVDAKTFITEGSTYTSEPFHCAAYKDFLMLIDHKVSGAPTDIVIKVQFSDDGVNWYNLMIDFWSDLRYEDSAGNLMEALPSRVLAPYIRLYLVSSGCTASKYFTESIKLIFNS